ncbi:hypothetical protein [Stenotrophomonas maltophilia]|uniref:hypothetical protein n=1 Tax=Stenotrophomonas maltophilia TaxID=40324 RepID=UPI0039F64D54
MSEKDHVGISRELLQKIAALEFTMICVCQSHPDRDALGRQVQSLLGYLEESKPAGVEKMIELIETMSGFTREMPTDAP